MSRPIALILAAAVVVAGGLLSEALVVSSAGASTAAPAPHIVAKPNSVMVNTTTKLTGTHFPASTKITIKECPQTLWVVPANPCDTDNSITVKTNAQGQFHAVFTVHTCPDTVATPPGTSQTCYIGDPHPSGIDTITLEGAVKITVTGP
jgi:hypothetical protein